MCDQISDAILDAHLKQDPDAKVACETVTKTGMIMVRGLLLKRNLHKKNSDLCRYLITLALFIKGMVEMSYLM